MIQVRYPALVIVAGVLLCRAGVSDATDLDWKIDEETAQHLAAEGWDHGKSPRWFDYDPGLGRPFFVFYGLNKSDGGFGYFAVNPWTGEVWALWGCHKLSTPALRRDLAAIQRRFKPEEIKEYARLSRLKPECIVED